MSEWFSLYQMNYFYITKLSSVWLFSVDSTFLEMQSFAPLKTVILCYCFKSVSQSGSDQCWQYPLENRHMEKLKPGLQKAELLIELLSKVFFISGTIRGECRLVCSRVQMAWLTTIEREWEEEGRGTDREADTYPWQCFLFMEGVLGFDGRLSGAVGEECTTCNRGTAHINLLRITQN